MLHEVNPPRVFSSISTVEPKLLAVKAWPNSWMRIEKATIATQAITNETSPYENPRSAATIRNDGRTVTGIPNRRKVSTRHYWPGRRPRGESRELPSPHARRPESGHRRSNAPPRERPLRPGHDAHRQRPRVRPLPGSGSGPANRRHARGMGFRELTATRSRGREPGCLRRAAGARRGSHRPPLRPLRRSAHRSHRRLGDQAIRARGTGRPTLRTGLGRRQVRCRHAHGSGGRPRRGPTSRRPNVLRG